MIETVVNYADLFAHCSYNGVKLFMYFAQNKEETWCIERLAEYLNVRQSDAYQVWYNGGLDLERADYIVPISARNEFDVCAYRWSEPFRAEVKEYIAHYKQKRQEKKDKEVDSLTKEWLVKDQKRFKGNNKKRYY